MQPRTITIDYKPRVWAKALHATAKRWIVLVLHRRAGKTTAVINHLQRDALRVPNAVYAYIGPTYKQAKFVAWDILKKCAGPIPGTQFLESELTVKYPNGSKLILVGADNPDSLRGMALWGAGFDEYPLQPPKIFTEIISKCLADHLGYAVFFGTPKGKNSFWLLYEAAKGSPDWEVVYRTIDDSLAEETGETIDNLRQALEDDKKLVELGVMTQDEFEQEWYCSFEAPVKGAVYGREWSELTKDGRCSTVEYDPRLPTYSAWDFGWADATSILVFQVLPGPEAEVRLIHEYEEHNQKLQHYVDWLKALRGPDGQPYKWRAHFGDPSGANKNLNTGKSLFEDMAAQGIVVTAMRTREKDKLHAAKKLLAKLRVANHLHRFVECVTNYKFLWDERRNEWQEEPFHDEYSHMMDAFAYFAVNYQQSSHPKSDTEKKIAELKKKYEVAFGQQLYTQ